MGVVRSLRRLLYAALTLLAHELVRVRLLAFLIIHYLEEVVVLLNNTEDAVERHQGV